MNETRRTREEIANVLTHGVGAVASTAAGSVLITLAAVFGSERQVVAAAVFAASLLLLYTASTLYHAALRESVRARLKVLDHAAIYVLIAGTYTPFTLVSLHGRWGWSLFGVVWALAAAGIVFKLFFTGRLRRLSTLLYLAMGWLVLIAARPLVHALSTSALLWLAAGGLAYTAGTVFYHNRRIPFSHAIWHLFVLAGSVCHFVAVTTQVVHGPL